MLLTCANLSLSTIGDSPETADHLCVQKPQRHGGPIWLAQASISSKVSAQTFW